MLSAAVGVGEGPQAKARQRMCKRDLEIVHDVFWDRDAKSRCVANGKLKGRVRDDRRRAHHTVSLLRSLVFDCSCLALSLPLLDLCAFAYRASASFSLSYLHCCRLPCVLLCSSACSLCSLVFLLRHHPLRHVAPSRLPLPNVRNFAVIASIT